MVKAEKCWNFCFLHRTKHKMEEEVLYILSFTEVDTAVIVLVDSTSTSSN